VSNTPDNIHTYQGPLGLYFAVNREHYQDWGMQYRTDTEFEDFCDRSERSIYETGMLDVGAYIENHRVVSTDWVLSTMEVEGDAPLGTQLTFAPGLRYRVVGLGRQGTTVKQVCHE